MKKSFIVILMVIGLNALTACGSISKTKEKSGSSIEQVSSLKTKNSKEISRSFEETSSSSGTFHTSDGINSDLGQARIALYESGINSSGFSDNQILKYWNYAKAQGIDFIDFFKSQTSSSTD